MRLGVRYLGKDLAYEPVWAAMKKFTDERTADTQDEIWLLEHSPVFTQGQAGKPEHLLFTGDIPVVQSDRGGQVTYHGPGQITAYILVDINRKGLGPRTLVDAIEQTLVQLLDGYGIKAHAKSDAPGVYVDASNNPQGTEDKVASLGLRIRKGFSFHGLALNVDMDLEPFSRINPCGYAGMNMCHMAQYVNSLNIDHVSHKLVEQLISTLSYEGIDPLGSQLP